MAGCEILDFKCIYLSEIVGNAGLGIVILAIMYFIIASKMRLGFDTTIAFAFPLLLIGGIMTAGFSVIFAFSTVIIGLMLAWVFTIIIKGG